MDRVDFLDKLPYFYNNGITSPILKAEEKERNILFDEIEDTLKQFFVETATWGLEYWERMLEIKQNSNKGYEERRSVILAKMKIAQVSTVEAIRRLCLGFFNVTNAYVYEDNANYTFYVELENPNLEKGGLDDLCNSLNTYKPAHLGYRFVFVSKGYTEISTSIKKGFSKLPICNTFNSGTWWKAFNQANIHHSATLVNRSKHGYSNLVICGLYRSKNDGFVEDKQEDEFTAIVGKAIVGKGSVYN